MRIYDYHAYDWNKCVAPHGNMGKVDPDHVAYLCDKNGIPWWTSAWPYASGVKVYCENDELWLDILNKSRET